MIVKADDSPAPRVVIDTSVTLPILIRQEPGTSRLLQLWQNNRILPLHNRDTIAELRGKLLEHSPTAKHLQAVRFAETALGQYLRWSQEVPLQQPDSTNRPQCRDPSDQKFVDLAITGYADFLITGDQDLLTLNHSTSFEIIKEDVFVKTVCP